MTSSPASPAERLAGLHPSPLYTWCHPCWPPAPAILMHHAHAAKGFLWYADDALSISRYRHITADVQVGPMATYIRTLHS